MTFLQIKNKYLQPASSVNQGKNNCLKRCLMGALFHMIKPGCYGDKAWLEVLDHSNCSN